MNNAVEIPFSYIEKSFMVVPIKINDSVTKNFILDTGIGLNLISKSLCEKIGCKINGSHTFEVQTKMA
jgi:Aspartyl protease